jgi:RES domain-containing protein
VIALPAGLGGTELSMWRLDREVYKSSWNSGEGARRSGGRWNSVGQKVVYCSVDPATAILEVAVHTGFPVLDTVPHVLTAARVLDHTRVFVVQHEHVPNPNWLRPGTPGSGQQGYGDSLLRAHPFVLIPSAVSTFSWNLIFNPETAEGLYVVQQQDRFALDTRLHPPKAK